MREAGGGRREAVPQRQALLTERREAGDVAEWNRELDRWLFEDGRGLPLRWWEPGETAALVRERIGELARLTGRRVVWCRLDLRRMEWTEEEL